MYLELRKKSLCLINDSQDNPTQKHINELIFSTTKDDNSIIVLRKIRDYQLRFRNYYTIARDTKIYETKNGKDTHIFLPFETKESILGLDNYLIPLYEMKTDVTNLNIGDSVLVDDEKIVIIEKEEIAFFGTVSTYLVGAIASKRLEQ
jgi:hypothetical protein